MDFTNKMSNWQNAGTAPSADLQENGFQPGQRPPASVFNWQWHQTSAAITELQEKLSEVDSTSEENQNAFSNVKVGSTTIAADSKTDTLTLEAGANISITPENDKVTISNTYTLPTAASSTLGGVKAVAKTDAMTKNVGVDSDGQLWIESTGGTPLMDDSGVLTWGEVDSDVDVSIFSSYAMKNHASTTTENGAADGTHYGHVKLSASTSSSSGVSAGVAATPSAVKSAKDAATAAQTTANSALETANSALAAANSAASSANDKAPAYTYGTEDLTAGTSELATGTLHFVYE